MSRKFRAPKTRRPRVLHLDDFDIVDQLKLLAAWSPPQHAEERSSSPWLTWSEYLADYAQIRDECHQLLREGRQIMRGGLPFAERAWQYRARFGAEALEAASYDEVKIFPLEHVDAA